jgi:integral membrane protein
MLVKWVIRSTEIGVQVFGPIHGALFVAYVVITIWTARTYRWRLPTTLLALAASIPPLATLWSERRAQRTGLLGRSSAVASRAGGS